VGGVTELLTSALQAHRAGKLDEARSLYEQVLTQDPDLPDGWHFLGLLAFQSGNREGGITALRRTLELSPDYADAHANLANMLLAKEQIAEAATHLDRAIALAPDSLPPRIALAMIRRHSGQAAEAEALLRPALVQHPDNVAVLYGIANALMELGRPNEALDHIVHLVSLKQDVLDLGRLMGYALGKLGRNDEAADYYRQRLAADPNDAEAHHLLAAVGGTQTPTRASNDYLRRTFDNFSATFEAQLASLNYRAPQLIRAAVAQCQNPSERQLHVLDAGCGTGLVGALLKPWSAHLSGVDLSKGMLERARGRGIYDTLAEGELTAFLVHHPATYDLVASADTLIYFGALEEFAARAFDSLRDGGWLIFSVEDGGDQAEDYRLQFHGRYTHRIPYVVRVLEEAGFADIRVAQDVVRHESGIAVPGLILAASKHEG
jgi:predicted TPR repeat methyltransferase